MAVKETHIAGPEPLSSLALWGGAALWLAFSILAVSLYGPVWDESYEHAQVLRGDIPYPAGHPMKQYMFGAYTVQHYVTAALMVISQNPVWICGFRGVLSLGMTAIPLFLLAAALARRALAGHVAVLVMLSGAFLPFASTYPLVVWWSTYSNGQVGLGFALLALAMLSLRRWRTAALLAGIMPAVHLGQWPPVLGVGLIAAGVAWRWGDRDVLKQCIGIAAGGMTASVAFGLIQRVFIPALPASGAYALVPDAGAIDDVWRGFTFFADGHRALPPVFTLVAALMPAVLGALLVLRWRNQPARALDAAWPVCHAAGTAAVVTVIAGVQTRMGTDTPFVLVSWMPYRLLNHLPFITAALALGMLGALAERRHGTNLLLAAAALALTPALGRLIGGDFVARYVAGGDGVLFAVTGMGLGVLTVHGKGLERFAALFGLLLVVAVIGWFHRFGAACMVAGALVPWLIARMDDRADFPVRAAVGVALLPVVFTVAWLGYTGGLRGPRLPDELASVAQVLSTQGAPDGIVLGHPYSRTLQGRLHHPVHCDAVVAWIIAYDLPLGPVIDQMYRDGYGITLSLPDREMPRPHWTEVWKTRTCVEWRELGERYGIQFVLAPPEAQPLDLPVIAAHPGGLPDVLYRIPHACNGGGR